MHAHFRARQPDQRGKNKRVCAYARACIGIAGSGSSDHRGEYDKQLHKLVQAFNGIDRVDKMVLPLPYSQLLKLFSLFYVFSVPFVLAPEVGFLTPFITVFLKMGWKNMQKMCCL